MNSSHAQVFLGQAGWDDEDVVAFPGSMEDDGHTLVRCQLFTGRDITKEHTPGRAQGTRLVCHVSDGVFKIPVKGARVYIVIPHGMEGVAGAGLIVGVVTPGVERSGNPVEGDVTLSCSTGQGRVRIKQNGDVTLYTNQTNEEGGKPIFLRISTKGLEFYSPYGGIKMDSSGFHVTTAAGPAIDMGGLDLSSIPGIGALPPAVLGALTSYCTITAPTFHAECSQVLLGAGAVCQPAVFAPINVPLGAVPPSVLPPSAEYQSQTVYIAS